MAKVKPFRGVRPPREIVTDVVSRPYDVLNSAEARSEAEGNPKSLYHIIKPEIDFDRQSGESGKGGGRMPWAAGEGQPERDTIAGLCGGRSTDGIWCRTV